MVLGVMDWLDELKRDFSASIGVTGAAVKVCQRNLNKNIRIINYAIVLSLCNSFLFKNVNDLRQYLIALYNIHLLLPFVDEVVRFWWGTLNQEHFEMF